MLAYLRKKRQQTILNNKFIDAVAQNQLDIVDEYLQQGANGGVDDNFAIKYASKYGFVDIIQRLLMEPTVKPAADDNEALWWAVVEGQPYVIPILLGDSRVVESVDFNQVLTLAVKHGQLEVLKVLLQKVHFELETIHKCLWYATRYGMVYIAHALLKDERVKATMIVELIKFAYKQKVNPVMIKMLLNDPRVDKASLPKEITLIENYN